MKYLTLMISCAFLLGAPAFAKTKTTALEKAKAAMVTACEQKYPQVKGKSFEELAEWAEAEERGENGKAFKKTKCYTKHEAWETVAHTEEKGEEHETQKE